MNQKEKSEIKLLHLPKLFNFVTPQRRNNVAPHI